jgi:hypothetical protein
MEDFAELPTRLLSAQLLAVEVLLADPETLGNDALERDLYILRDQLRAATGAGREVPATPRPETRNADAPQALRTRFLVPQPNCATFRRRFYGGDQPKGRSIVRLP